MSRFAAVLGAAAGRTFATYPDLHAFSAADYRVFWRTLLQVHGHSLGITGDPSETCRGEDCETAVFFPGLRLNYARALLGPEVAPDCNPALRQVQADGTVRCWTRGDLRLEVERVAHALGGIGLQPGDRVVAVMRNDARAVVMALAVTALGATLSAAAPDMGVQALLDRFAQLSPCLLVAHAGDQAGSPTSAMAEKLASVCKSIGSVKHAILLDGEARIAGVHVSRFEDFATGGPESAFEWPEFAFNQPLFILFSSGTTGRPKCIVHGAGGTLLEHVKEHRLHCDLDAGDRLYFHTSCGWMMWNWQLSALASGTEIVTFDGHVDTAGRLWQIVADQKVTVFGTSPGYLRMCQEAALRPSAMGLGALRAVLSTGSILHDSQFRWVRDNARDVPVQTISGGSDIIGCFVLGHPDLPVVDGEAQCKSLGLDVQAWQDGCAAAGIGHLVCTNPFPSRPLGFFGDPGGERFHHAYFTANPGTWTHGDLVEFSANGGARMHGRSDGILNVRGTKIAPGEIYGALQAFEGIREAIVVQRDHPALPNDQQMVALLVMDRRTVLDASFEERIRKHLARELGAAYVPDRILDVPELPMTHSGKLSEAAARAALAHRPAENVAALRNPECLGAIASHPALDPPAPRREFSGTQTVPELVSRAWEEVLGVSPATPHASFFELGGNSLLAARLVRRVRDLTGRELALGSLVHAPTLEEFTAAVQRGGATSDLVVMRRGEGRPLFLVHGVSGTVMECWMLMQALRTTRPLIGLQARGLDGEQPPQRCIRDIAATYVDRMRGFQAAGPYSICGFSFGGVVALEMGLELRRRSYEVHRVIALDPHVECGAGWMARCSLRVAHVVHTLRSRGTHDLPGFLAAKLKAESARLHGGRPRPSAGTRLSETQAAVFDALHLALEQYRPAQLYDTPVLIVRANPPRNRYRNSLDVWRRTVPDLRLVQVAGEHTDLVARHGREVALIIDEALEAEEGMKAG